MRVYVDLAHALRLGFLFYVTQILLQCDTISKRNYTATATVFIFTALT